MKMRCYKHGLSITLSYSVRRQEARGISINLRKLHSGIPWREIINLRNELVHEYFTIDTEEVWKVVERDLPNLKRKLKVISQGLEKEFAEGH